MPKKTSTRIPSLRNDKGRAFVELNGRRRYLGKWGEASSQEAYERTIAEVKYGVEGRSRIDLLLSRGGQAARKGSGRAAMLSYEGDERVYVEVKNTTLITEAGQAAFPDAVTERGRKHLGELADVVRSGHRAAMVFSVQRSDCQSFVPADDIDPAYGRALREALHVGVEAYALAASIGPRQIQLKRRLPVEV